MGAAGKRLLIVGLVSGIVLSLVPFSGGDPTLSAMKIVLGLFSLGLILGGGYTFFRGRQYMAQETAETVFRSGEDTVLYLRSFKDDSSVAGQTFLWLLTSAIVQGWATDEERLAGVFRPFGALVAIGEPGERLPLPGAARQYVDHPEWQRLVTEMMKESRLVVLRAGLSEGLLWELGRALETVPPERVLVLTMGMSSRKYAKFRERANEKCGVTLPSRRPRSWGGLRPGYIRFSAAGEAEYVPVWAPFFRRGINAMPRMFTYSLQPVYEAQGKEWSPPPVSKLLVLWLVTFVPFTALLFLLAISSVLFR